MRKTTGILGLLGLAGSLWAADPTTTPVAEPEDAPIVFPDDWESETEPAAESQTDGKHSLSSANTGDLDRKLRQERERYTGALSELLDRKSEYNRYQLDDATLDAYEQLFRRSQVQSLRRQAYLAARYQDYELAEDLYIRVLSLSLDKAERRDILMEMANMFEQAEIRMKYVAVLEKFVSLFNSDPELPRVYLRLGRIYREVGAPRLALQRFYSVLNTSLSLGPDAIDTYKRLSVQAQFEIAETHFLLAHYEEAAKHFDRLKLLDLPPEERATAHFKASYTRYLMEQYAEVLAGLDRFIEQYPNSVYGPEARYVLATTYRKLGRFQDAVTETLTLLRTEAATDPERLIYWQRKTGNQLANEFYEEGDYLAALRIYQAMAPLSNAPSWQWPVIYQIGLCFERLGMEPRAMEAFRLIVTAEEWEDEDLDVSESVRALQEMAQWRLEHLQWATQARGSLQEIQDPASTFPDPSILANESGNRP